MKDKLIQIVLLHESIKWQKNFAQNQAILSYNKEKDRFKKVMLRMRTLNRNRNDKYI